MKSLFINKHIFSSLQISMLITCLLSNSKALTAIILISVIFFEFIKYKYNISLESKKNELINNLLLNSKITLTPELREFSNNLKLYNEFQEKVTSSLKTIQNSRLVEQILFGEEDKELAKVILEVSDLVESDNQDFLMQKIELISKNKDLELAQKFLEDKSEELERLTRHKSKFLTNMSHEFRTPLNGIINFSEFALESKNSKDKKSYLNNIRESGKHLLGIINDILDLSAIEVGKFELISENFNINKKVNFVVELAKTLGKEKGIEVIATIDSNIPLILYGDARRFTQVLINLINNSVKFNKNEGSIIINIFADKINEDNIVLGINISDTGKGIPEDFQRDMCKPFIQMDDSLKRNHEGSGLGLAITSHILKLMDGKIEIASKLNLGTNFKVTIPFKFEQKNVSEEKVENLNMNTKLNILVAEDNNINQIIIDKIIREYNHNIQIVSDGAQALEKFKEDKFDLILMDIQMPNMDGIEATQKIIEYEKENNKIHIPIIAVTAHALKEEKKRYLKNGMDGYVTKPIVKKELMKEIIRVTQNLNLV